MSGQLHADENPSMIEDKKNAEAAHLIALRKFASRIGLSEETAMDTYWQEIQSLSAGAKVTGFVEIIAEKRTKDALLARSARVLITT